MRDILLNANPETLRWIEFKAGTSNDIILSPDEAVLAKAMLQEAEQHSLAEKESRLRIALAPHKAVPTEVLRIIFQYIKTSTYFLVSLERGKYGPLRLSQVCSSWRAICRSQPCFWNDASFDRDWSKNDRDVKFWIANFIAESYPLSLRINRNYLVKSYRPSILTGYILRRSYPGPLHLLLSQYKLIRRLKINEAQDLLETPKHSFPLLEDLSIELDGAFVHRFQQSECFVGMKNLRTFAAKFYPPARQVSLAKAKLPWSQLTNLMIDFTEIRQFFNIEAAVELLKRCKNLQKCNISVRTSYMPCNLTALLPDLTDLVLISSTVVSRDTFSLTDFLIMPSLESLNIRTKIIAMDFWRGEVAIKPDIGYLVHNSGRSIRTLILQGINTRSVDTDLKLEEQPSLQTLEAPTTIFSNETIDEIAEGILLPNIQILSLSIRSLESLEHLTKLVEKKSSSLSPILFIDAKVIERVERTSVNSCYIRRGLERITACGSEINLRYSDEERGLYLYM